MRSTYTIAGLEVSQPTYEEIASKLRTAGYDHAFHDELVDMHGIGLKPETTPYVALMVIGTDEQHQLALAEVERLMLSDPAPGTREGDRLETLAILVEAYERVRFPLSLVRYCYECGSIGPVPKTHLACCPDHGHAVMVPPEVAKQARAGFLQSIAPSRNLWRIEHADGKRWRTMDSLGCPDWTDDPEKALTCTLREHIDAYAADDSEEIKIVEVPVAAVGVGLPA